MICSECGERHQRKGQSYCNACHAAYMRGWRPAHPLTPEQRMKDTARSYANVYRRRGNLVPEPCECGEEKVEMHHPDYQRPTHVQWMCRPCHLNLHQGA